jgi:hypothetical protein
VHTSAGWCCRKRCASEGKTGHCARTATFRVRVRVRVRIRVRVRVRVRVDVYG